MPGIEKVDGVLRLATGAPAQGNGTDYEGGTSGRKPPLRIPAENGCCRWYNNESGPEEAANTDKVLCLLAILNSRYASG